MTSRAAAVAAVSSRGERMQVGAIIAAAGAGRRLGRGSKALVALNGRSTVARAVALALSVAEIDRILVMAPATEVQRTEEEIAALSPRRPVGVRAGGATRQESVRLGLAALGACSHVLIHDAARPLATPDLFRRVLAAAVRSGAAIPGVAPPDALKRVREGRLAESLDRSSIVLAQTPQAFRYELLVLAHAAALAAGIQADDDSALVAAAGHEVTVVAGEPGNIKLTTEADFGLLEALLREREAAWAT